MLLKWHASPLSTTSQGRRYPRPVCGHSLHWGRSHPCSRDRPRPDAVAMSFRSTRINPWVWQACPDEAEANNANGGGPAARVLADSNIENHDTGGGSAPHQLYLERLKKLRAQGGLDRASSASSGVGTASSQSSVYRIAATSSTVESYSSTSSRSNYTVSSEAETESTSSSSTLTAGSTGQPDVDAIRRRLERIKASGSAVM